MSHPFATLTPDLAQTLSKTPIVRLKLLLNPRFASVIAIVFVAGLAAVAGLRAGAAVAQ